MRTGETGLAGIGRLGEWIVELDEDSGGEFSISISHRRFSVQLPRMTTTQTRAFHTALAERQSAELCEMLGATLRLEAERGRARLQLRAESVLFEVTLDESELGDLARTLREACSDAGVFCEGSEPRDPDLSRDPDRG